MFNNDQLHEIEKLHDIQMGQLTNLANTIAHNLIIAEANEEKNAETIKILKKALKQVDEAMDKNTEIRTICETERNK